MGQRPTQTSGCKDNGSGPSFTRRGARDMVQVLSITHRVRGFQGWADTCNLTVPETLCFTGLPSIPGLLTCLLKGP